MTIDQAQRKRRIANLRRNRVTVIKGFAPGDSIRAVWDGERRGFRIVVESANGLTIAHQRLTGKPFSA